MSAVAKCAVDDDVSWGELEMGDDFLEKYGDM